MRRVGYSESTPADFKYEITVASISPATGSKAGGTVLTIVGTNFAPTLLDNNVLIGDGTGLYDQFCDMLTVKLADADNGGKDVLTCLTPEYSLFDGYTGDIKILVQGRLLETASCDAAVC